MRLARTRFLAVLLLGLAADVVLAQQPRPSARPAAVVAADSPRASMTRYLQACRAGDYATAARYLRIPAERQADAPLLARRLKAVLDTHLWIDLDLLSAVPEGDVDDRLPRGTDELGTIADADGHAQPVRIVRLTDADEPHWAFASSTVAHVDAWYEALGHHLLREHVPDVLLRPGPRELLRWQWLALPLLLAVAWGCGRLLAYLTLALVRRIARRTANTWDDTLAPRYAGPVVLGFTLCAVVLLLPLLGLTPPAHAALQSLVGAAVVLAIFWSLWCSVDAAIAYLLASAHTHDNASARSLLAVGGRLCKVAVVFLGLGAALAQLGYPVASLLAGLGIGGLALALGAQKTLEHLFGSLALAVDQPFRVGDVVKVEDFTGTVEAIGLRSTRFRTPERTLVSIPNGRLAEMRLESVAARDRMRLACTLGLVYGTSAEQVRSVLAGVEQALRAHPKLWPELLVVRLKDLAASSLDVEIVAYFLVTELPEYYVIRQELLLQFMEVIERAGTQMAFPTSTVYVAREPDAATTSGPTDTRSSS